MIFFLLKKGNWSTNVSYFFPCEERIETFSEGVHLILLYFIWISHLTPEIFVFIILMVDGGWSEVSITAWNSIPFHFIRPSTFAKYMENWMENIFTLFIRWNGKWYGMEGNGKWKGKFLFVFCGIEKSWNLNGMENFY